MKRVFAFLLCVALLVCLLPAQFAEAESLTDEEILKQRRDTVYNTMMSMATVMWRATEDITYTFGSSTANIKAGRLYRGMPYTYARGTLASFMEYTGEANEKGEYELIGVTHEMLDGGSVHARLGNDCSGAASVAYASVSATTKNVGASTVTVNKGFLPVGIYTPNPASNSNSKQICIDNGQQVMFESYAAAQYADLVSMSSHTMMTQSVKVVRNADGTIDGAKSTMTVVHQIPDPIREEQYYTTGPYSEENYGEKVYITYKIDHVVSFNTLYSTGYLPYTCIELIDPSPIPEVTVTDTETEHNFKTIMTGTIKANRLIDSITMTITDEHGVQLQQGTARCYRYGVKGTNTDMVYDLNQLRLESPMKMKGTLNPNLLGVGNYHCRLDIRLMTGQVVEKVRDFDFTVTKDDLCEGWVDNSNLVFTDGNKAVCPVCGGDPVAWTKLSSITANMALSGHYYLAEDINNTARLSVSKNKTACLHLNGHNITSSIHVFFLNSENSLLNVMGNGIVKGNNNSSENDYGATIHHRNITSNATLYGGTYGHGNGTDRPTVRLESTQPKLIIYGGATLCRMDGAQGANIEIRNGTVELRGGRILDGTSTTGSGGNVRVYSSSTYTGGTGSNLNMYSGIISGGRAKYGGNIFIYGANGTKNRTFNMYDGLVTFGFAGYQASSAGSGGNIYARKNAVINQTGGVISCGMSYSGGGNIYVREKSQTNIGGVVEKGNGDYGSSGTISGGNIYVYETGTKLTITGVVRNPRLAVSYGGNIFITNAEVVVDGGTVSGGKATNRGGNVYLTNTTGPKLTVKNNGKIIDGTAVDGGNVATNSGYTTINVESGGSVTGGIVSGLGADISLHAGATVNISDGTVGEVYGYTGKFNLSGTAGIEKLTFTSGTMKIDNGWTGTMDVNWGGNYVTDGVLTKASCGSTTDGTFTAGGSFNGKLVYNGSGRAMGEDGKVYLVAAGVANATGESLYQTVAEAVEAAGETDIVKLYTDVVVTANKDLHLDINGHTVTADCTGTVYASDSTATTKVAGTGTLSTAAKVAKDYKADGVRYIALNDGNTYTLHTLELKLKSVALRTTQAGIYYKGEIKCDPQLAAATAYHGIALSVVDMPGADFETAGTDAYTRIAGAPADVFTSGSVFNIFKNDLRADQNTARGETQIFANAYVQLNDGSVIMASTGEESVSMSLKNVLLALDENLAAYESQLEQVVNFYNAWKTAMTGWNLDNIAAVAAK